MTTYARMLLNLCSRWRARRQFDALHVGRHSQVCLWRLRARHGGRLRIGESSCVETRLTIERAGGCVTIGDRSFIGQGHLSCASLVEVGDDVLIAWGTAIFDHGSHALRFSKRAHDVLAWLGGEKDWSEVPVAPVRIGNKAWIGFGCIVLPGVTVGEGAVVGAGSVVTHDLPPWTVAAGNPARVIRVLNDDER